MAEQILIVTMAAFIALLVPLCCYLLSVLPGVRSELFDIREWMRFHNGITREIEMDIRDDVCRLVDWTTRRKPRYRVANAIAKLPRKRKGVVANGIEVMHGY